MSSKPDPVTTLLFANLPVDISPSQGELLVEQYKLYAHSHEIISERREGMNKFFVTLNSAIVAAIGLLPSNGTTGVAPRMIIPIAALLICVFWFLVIRAYDQLNTGKFKVLHAVERRLPLGLYEAEWEALGRGEDPSLYTPISRLERWVPVIFGAIYLVTATFTLIGQEPEQTRQVATALTKSSPPAPRTAARPPLGR